MPTKAVVRDYLYKKVLRQLDKVYCLDLPQAKHIQQKVSKERVWLR